MTEALIDGEYAVVVTEDEQAQQPNTATVIDLATGEKSVLDGSSDVPTTTGGTWALGDGTLAHATLGPGRRYCLATVDLASMSSTTGWCAPPRNGFSGARVTPEGIALLAFDDQRPSCRTVGEVDDDELEPLEGVPDCTGWDATARSTTARCGPSCPKERRIEEAHFYARSEDGLVRPRPGHVGQPDLVRRLGVLRPGPAVLRRPGAAAVVVPRRRPRRGLRDGGPRPGVPHRAALRRHRPHHRRPDPAGRHPAHRERPMSERLGPEMSRFSRPPAVMAP